MEEKEEYTKEDIEKEINILKKEVKGGNVSVELEKEAFKKKLMGGMGEDMLETLKHPKKPSFWVGLKYKYARWKTIRDGKRAARKWNKKNGNL